MSNQEYWEKRIANNTWETYNSLEEKNRAVFSMYKEASEEIAKEIYKVGEKLKAGTPSLSDMHKYNRLNHLKTNIDGIVQELMEKTEKQATAAMQDGYKLTYKACSEGMGVDFTLPDKKLMEETLKRPWLGSNFSKRLWGNAKELEKQLNSTLLRGLQQGKTVTEMAIQLDNVMHKGFNAAHRLVRTESMHYMNQAALQSYIDADITSVRVWAATDERTCSICKQYHNKLYPIDKVPVLPLHANCRCTIIPEIDEDGLEEQNKRPITMITEDAINRVEKVSIPGYSDGECRYIQQQHKELLRTAMRDNDSKEIAFVHSMDLRDRRIIWGDESHVGLETDKLRMGKGLMVMHNHPRNSSFSKGDLRQFLLNSDIRTMTIIKNNGNVEAITKEGKVNIGTAIADLTFIIAKPSNIIDKWCKKGIIKWVK